MMADAVVRSALSTRERWLSLSGGRCGQNGHVGGRGCSCCRCANRRPRTRAQAVACADDVVVAGAGRKAGVLVGRVGGRGGGLGDPLGAVPDPDLVAGDVQIHRLDRCGPGQGDGVMICRRQCRLSAPGSSAFHLKLVGPIHTAPGHRCVGCGGGGGGSVLLSIDSGVKR